MTDEILNLLENPSEDDLNFNGLKMLVNYVSPENAAKNKAWNPKKKSQFVDFKNAKKGTKCHFVSKIYQDASNVPKNIASNVLTWNVPNPDGTSSFDLCFYVKEVQEFITENAVPFTAGDPQKQFHGEPDCIMFEPDQINGLFQRAKLEFKVSKKMLPEFYTAFIEYDLWHVNEKHKSSDVIRDIAVEFLQQYLTQNTKEVSQVDTSEENKQETTQKSSWLRVPGMFWYATKKSLTFLFDTIFANTVKITLWFLRNPTYLYRLTVALRTIRLVICVYTSFDNIADAAIDVLFDRLIESAVGFAAIPYVVAKAFVKCLIAGGSILMQNSHKIGFRSFNCASSLYETFTSTLALFVPNAVLNFTEYSKYYIGNTLMEIGGFLNQAMEPIFSQLGIQNFTNMFRFLNGNEKELLGIIGYAKNETIMKNLTIAFQSWKAADMSFATILMLFDIFIAIADIFVMPEDSIRTISMLFAKMIPLVGGLLAAKIDKLLPVMTHEQAMKRRNEELQKQTQIIEEQTKKEQNADIVAETKVAVKIPGMESIKTSRPIHTVLTTKAIRILLYSMRLLLMREKYYEIIREAIEEIKEWFNDVLPCLFRRISDLAMYLFSFGSVTNYYSTAFEKSVQASGKETFKATCCMTSIIRDIQKQVALGEMDRIFSIAKANAPKYSAYNRWFDRKKHNEYYESTTKFAHEQLVLDEFKNKNGFVYAYATSNGLADVTDSNFRDFTPDFKVAPNFIRDLQSSAEKALADTMTIERQTLALPCVEQEYINFYHLPTWVIYLKLEGTYLPFYCCFDGKHFQWLLNTNDVLPKFAHLTQKINNNHVVVPIEAFTQKQQIFLADLETPVVDIST